MSTALIPTLIAMVLPRGLAAEPPAIVGCQAAVSTQAVVLDLEPAERAYAEATDAGILEFQRRLASLHKEIPCLGERLPPDVVARVHRVFGLEAWLGRTKAGALPARAYFAAARHLAPEYAFPPTLVGPEDPENREYIAALIDLDEARPEPARTGLDVIIDGVRPGVRQPDWPVLLQWTNEGSEVIRCSEYLLPGDPGTCGTALGAPIAAVHSRKTRGLVTLAGSAVALGGGVGLEVWNLGRRTALGMDTACSDVRKDEPDTAHDCLYSSARLKELDSISAASQAAAIGLAALGGVGLVYGGITFFVDERPGIGVSMAW